MEEKAIPTDVEWDRPLVCPVDPKELSECEACQ